MLRSSLCCAFVLGVACSSTQATSNDQGAGASGAPDAAGGSNGSGAKGGSGGSGGSKGGSGGSKASGGSGGSKGGSGGSATGDAGGSEAGQPGTGGSEAGQSGTSGGSGGSGGSPTQVAEYETCIALLECIGNCPDGDDTCPDACYNAASLSAQDELVALLTCMTDNGCEDVTCTEGYCGSELTTCLDSNAAGGGTPTSGGDLPPGDIPAELVGHWSSPSSTEVSDFTFNADGTAEHANYRETSLGSCDMVVTSQWNDGTVVASGDTLTVSLAEGTTSVAWSGGCGTGYTNPAAGSVLSYSYVLDSTGLWLTDLGCSGDYCEEHYQKN